jgi:hypothetical protein
LSAAGRDRQTAAVGPVRVGPRNLHLLAALILASWCLATAHALIRPLFQVSDELNYLHTVQVTALQSAPESARACVVPPDGVPLAYPPGGGKIGFHHLSARILLTACHLGAGATAIPLTRAVLALTLPVLVICTWALARVVLPQEPQVAAAAAIFTAMQPVLATFSGGVTPDGLANAASALTLLLAAHVWLNRASGVWLVPLAAAALAAIASKDSALFLGPVVLLVIGAWAFMGGQRRGVGMLCVLAVGSATFAQTFGGSRLATPFPNLDVVASEALLHPGRFAAVVLSAYATHGAGLARSGLGGLSNFGGGDLELAGALLLLQAVVVGVGLLGMAARVFGTNEPRLQRFAISALVVVVIAALQLPVRQMMTDSLGPLQGRWLFPIWPLIALACATGWDHLLRRPGYRALPLLSVAGGVIAMVALTQVVGYYYVEWPAVYAWPHVFLRAAEGHDVGTPAARAIVTAVVVPDAWRHAIALFALASVVLVQVASARLATPAAAADLSDVRHADHR